MVRLKLFCYRCYIEQHVYRKRPQQLLKAMSPELLAGDYVFCSLPLANYGDYATTKPIASFQRDEGLSLSDVRRNG
ncbi:MAG: ACT domain-containing protein [Deinococcales bacterium]